MHIITGWNRGGLSYVRRLLQANGFSVGSDVFTSETSHDNLGDRLRGARDFEVSSFAVPFLNSALLSKAKVTFVLRDPLRALNSLYFLGRFHVEGGRGELQPFVYRYVPGLKVAFHGKPSQAGTAYLVRWLQLAAELSQLPLNTVRVEEGPRELIWRITSQRPMRPQQVSLTTETSNCQQQLLLSKLPATSRQLMQQLLQKLGYFEKEWLPRGGHAHYVNADWHC